MVLDCYLKFELTYTLVHTHTRIGDLSCETNTNQGVKTGHSMWEGRSRRGGGGGGGAEGRVW